MKKTFFAFMLLFSVCSVLAGQDWFSRMLPPTLVNSSGREFNTANELRGKTVLFYFSASWCGPCRQFTPDLVKFYRNTAKSAKLIVVFVSSDNNAREMQKYMKSENMPWLAIPFNAPERARIKKKFGVNGIPDLKVYAPDGEKISDSARWDVVILGNNAVKAWRSSRYRPLTYNDYKLREQEKAGKLKNSKKIRRK